MSLNYNEKNISLAKNLRKMQRHRRIIYGMISYQNMKFGFKGKK